jgi:hypothetical protein
MNAKRHIVQGFNIIKIIKTGFYNQIGIFLFGALIYVCIMGYRIYNKIDYAYKQGYQCSVDNRRQDSNEIEICKFLDKLNNTQILYHALDTMEHDNMKNQIKILFSKVRGGKDNHLSNIDLKGEIYKRMD